MLVMGLGHLSTAFGGFIKKYEAAQLTEPVYEYRLFETQDTGGSITFRHFFYGIFEVVSLLTRVMPADA